MKKRPLKGKNMSKEMIPLVNSILAGVEFIAKNKPELTLEYIRCIREPLKDRRAQNGENKKEKPATDNNR